MNVLIFVIPVWFTEISVFKLLIMRPQENIPGNYPYVEWKMTFFKCVAIVIWKSNYFHPKRIDAIRISSLLGKKLQFLVIESTLKDSNLLHWLWKMSLFQCECRSSKWKQENDRRCEMELLSSNAQIALRVDRFPLPAMWQSLWVIRFIFKLRTIMFSMPLSVESVAMLKSAPPPNESN